MNGKDFIRKVRKLGRQQGVAVHVTEQGKGSHKTLYYGDTFTRVKQGEINTGLLKAMCDQLGIDKEDL